MYIFNPPRHAQGAPSHHIMTFCKVFSKSVWQSHVWDMDHSRMQVLTVLAFARFHLFCLCFFKGRKIMPVKQKKTCLSHSNVTSKVSCSIKNTHATFWLLLLTGAWRSRSIGCREKSTPLGLWWPSAWARISRCACEQSGSNVEVLYFLEAFIS